MISPCVICLIGGVGIEANDFENENESENIAFCKENTKHTKTTAEIYEKIMDITLKNNQYNDKFFVNTRLYKKNCDIMYNDIKYISKPIPIPIPIPNPIPNPNPYKK